MTDEPRPRIFLKHAPRYANVLQRLDEGAVIDVGKVLASDGDGGALRQCKAARNQPSIPPVCISSCPFRLTGGRAPCECGPNRAKR